MQARTADDHKSVMQQALAEARKSPPKPTNFRVGALLVKLDEESFPTAVTGYTLECQGNTHAEESCLIKLAERHSTTEQELAKAITSPHALYTTMEPCSKRLSGKLPCVERVLRQSSWIKQVYVGVQEPDTFVQGNPGRRMLEEAGIEVHHVPGLEQEILEVATAGHIAQD
ncbi:hypothetical protein JDV02_008433 [Purpureocillium takamizusanense]|uniref:CMP/dCMP-type deaminase domain-containing protein n=1 Tax=Purpureocillium takamizusanense TaxID=2060973 RepID=A0A9Q8QK58_9HYPO|nr:uncharacterized protein JDV02_008433 [Purpureocillium takamizusanense]UNI22554.1 hypothetical protein JDV02_008433 [Purpureocillium takamizusanense]